MIEPACSGLGRGDAREESATRESKVIMTIARTLVKDVACCKRGISYCTDKNKKDFKRVEKYQGGGEEEGERNFCEKEEERGKPRFVIPVQANGAMNRRQKQKKTRKEWRRTDKKNPRCF